jgi:integrase
MAWSPSTARGAITALKVCLAWCARKGEIAANPIAAMKRPRMARRERILTADERARFRAAAGPRFGDYLDAVTWTGGRPGDVRTLEAAHVNWREQVARLPGKTTGATGELIELRLVAPMVALCRRLAAEFPDGPLFRNDRGEPWTRNAVRCQMRRLRQRLEVEGVTAYTYRHSFATDALERGVPVADVSALMNHRDIRTTMNYAHLHKKRSHLKAQAERALGITAPVPDTASGSGARRTGSAVPGPPPASPAPAAAPPPSARRRRRPSRARTA